MGTRGQGPRFAIIAPAETLRAWLGAHPCSVLDPAATGGRRLIQEVLDRKPLTGEHADLLEWGTGTAARFWLTTSTTTGTVLQPD